MKLNPAELLSRLPGRPTAAWPDGEPFVRGLAHGSMSLEMYAPVCFDGQSPHSQDELYFIHTGHGTLIIADEHFRQSHVANQRTIGDNTGEADALGA